MIKKVGLYAIALIIILLFLAIFGIPLFLVGSYAVQYFMEGDWETGLLFVCLFSVILTFLIIATIVTINNQ